MLGQNNIYELQLNNSMLSTCLGLLDDMDHSYKKNFKILTNERCSIVVETNYNDVKQCHYKKKDAGKKPTILFDEKTGLTEKIPAGYQAELNEDGSLKRNANGEVVKHRKLMRNDNVLRARDEVHDIMFCNWTPRTSFITLTYAENMQDWERAYDDLRSFLKNALPYYCESKDINYTGSYLWVSELQKRGAIHFHLVLFDVGYIPNKELRKLWKHGYVGITSGKNKPQDPIGAAKYLAKYIGKDIANVNANGSYRDVFYKSYNPSKGLKRAINIKCTDRCITTKDLFPGLKPVDTKTYKCDYTIETKEIKGYNEVTGEVIHRRLDLGYTEYTYTFDCPIDVSAITERTGERFFEVKPEEIYEDKYDRLQAEHLDKECDDFNDWFRRNHYHLQAGYVFSAFLDEMAKKDMFYSLRNRLKNEVIYRDNVHGTETPFYELIRKKYDYTN